MEREKFKFAGIFPFCSARTLFITPARPETHSVCPMLVLTLPTYSGKLSERLLQKVFARAVDSTLSPTCVPVPVKILSALLSF